MLEKDLNCVNHIYSNAIIILNRTRPCFIYQHAVIPKLKYAKGKIQGQCGIFTEFLRKEKSLNYVYE